MDNLEELIHAAKRVQANAVAPFSGYKVGAALCTTTGEIFVGANIEPVIPTLGICAERVALASALSAGHRVFEAIAVVTPEEKGIFPCGACRQMLFEFGGPELHVLAVGSELTQRVLLHSLLPEGFRGTNKT